MPFLLWRGPHLPVTYGYRSQPSWPQNPPDSFQGSLSGHGSATQGAPLFTSHFGNSAAANGSSGSPAFGGAASDGGTSVRETEDLADGASTASRSTDDGGTTVPESTADDGGTTVPDSVDDGGTTEPNSASGSDGWAAETDPGSDDDGLPLALRATVFDGFKNGRRAAEHTGVAIGGDRVILRAAPRLAPLPRPHLRAVRVYDVMNRSLGMLGTASANQVFDFVRQPALYTVHALFEPKRPGIRRASAPYVDITIERRV